MTHLRSALALAAGAVLVLALAAASLTDGVPGARAVVDVATAGAQLPASAASDDPAEADVQVGVEVTTGAEAVVAADLAPAYGPVEAVRPSLRIEGADSPQVGRIRAVEGVRAATAIQLGRMRLGGAADEGRELLVAAVDPVQFRELAPQVTADAVAVWERLDAGEAAFTHEVAGESGIALGDLVALGGATPVTVRVGAFASNGTPPVADVLVDRGTGYALGLSQLPHTVLVALDEDAVADTVAQRLRDQVDGEVSVIADPRPARQVTITEQEGAATVWDALALCESSGDWHINSGNGYYGGLQFLPESWWLVGGEGMPHEASREEQIHRAERLLAIQGWAAWPACSLQLGLRVP